MTSPEPPDPEEAGPADAGRPVSRWAIAAFLLGLVSLVPLSVIAGIVALVKGRHGRESGRGLAIAGMVISIVWAAIWAYSAWPPGTESRYTDNHAAECVAYFSSDRVGSIRG